MSLITAVERACAYTFAIKGRASAAARICVWQTKNLLAVFATQINVSQTTFTTAFAIYLLYTDKLKLCAADYELLLPHFLETHKVAHWYYRICIR